MDDHTAGQAGLTPGMAPLQMIDEWRNGCTIAGPRSKSIGIPGAEDKPELCPDCTLGLITAMEKTLLTMLPHLRALRKWHWKEALGYRNQAQMSRDLVGLPPGRKEHIAEGHDAMANWHIKAVQTLNDFFPVGDTAEKDASQ